MPSQALHITPAIDHNAATEARKEPYATVSRTESYGTTIISSKGGPEPANDAFSGVTVDLGVTRVTLKP